MYFITGGSRGIGRYMVEKLASSKNELILATYNNTLPSFEHPNVEWCKVDLRNYDEVEALINSKKDKLKQVKFINCAGLCYNAATHKYPEMEWLNQIQTNLTSPFYVSKLLLPYMREQEYGRIVFFSSVVAQIGVGGTPSYSASKSGLWGLMKSIVQENAAKKITCNTLNLGYFDIGMIREVPRNVLDEMVSTRVPNRTMGNPEDIYKTIELLVDVTYINGAGININGGLY
jgi:NAD(P)-dependent dehydrogenase (short-subunit alcohol dehydrogenase family)